MAALPDFDAGAMENWGLIFYREALMLYRSGVTSADDKKQITRVVAHELAHQVLRFPFVELEEKTTIFSMNSGLGTL